ncbi:MAG: hypothetical protein IKN74_02945 [Clostridia bacterium]|nr:hypothetical protein [Clostridia bacterium]
MNEELEEKREEENASKEYRKSISTAWVIMIAIILLPVITYAAVFIKLFVLSNI